MLEKNKIKVGVAGAGFIGPVHIESLRRIPGIEIVALCHSNEEAARQKANELSVPHYYFEFDEMLKNVELDSVHICTPNNLHYQMAKSALLAGKHVICDKPLALEVAQAVELIELAQDKNLIHAINFNIRYYPLARQMKRMRENGELGEIYSVMGSYLQDWLFYDTDYNWRVETSNTGSSKAIADIGSHLIDLIEYICGLTVSEVMADLSTIHQTRKKPLKKNITYSGKLSNIEDVIEVPMELEDHATVLLRFNNGKKGSITVSQVAAGRKNRLNLEISGSNCTMAWCSEDPNNLFIGRRDQPNSLLMRDPALVDKNVQDIISYPGGHNEGFGDTSKHLFMEIYEDIKQGTPSSTPSYPTFEHGLRELKICESIVLSHLQQKWVKL